MIEIKYRIFDRRQGLYFTQKDYIYQNDVTEAYRYIDSYASKIMGDGKRYDLVEFTLNSNQMLATSTDGKTISETRVSRRIIEI